MPKAGRYEYPSRELDDCIRFLQKAHEMAKEHVFTREGFANAIDQSVKGGHFNLLVGSLSMYKLVNTGEGEIRYTELAKIILHGEPKEKEEGKSQAARNIILFADIYDKFGTNPTDSQLRLFLREKANVKIDTVNSLAVEVGKLFKKVAGYLKPVVEFDNNGGEGKEVSTQIESIIPTMVKGTVTTSYSTVKIINKKTLDLAKKTLDMLDDEFEEDEIK